MATCRSPVTYRPLIEAMNAGRLDVKTVASRADVPLPRVIEMKAGRTMRRTGSERLLTGNQLVRMCASLGVPLGDVLIADAGGEG